ncbi:MAG TPA: hypothetical protein VMF89_16095 [Polyangiales bacterium]|nr:hypothetical protein [Polyangiales bacterium]
MACSTGPKVYMMETAYLVGAEGGTAFVGSGCDSVSDSAGAGTGFGGPDYEVTHLQQGDGILVTVRGAADEVLAEREYTEAFLATGEQKTLDVELGDGRTLRLRHWGGDSCEPDPNQGIDGGV